MSSRALRGRVIGFLSSFCPTLCSSHYCTLIGRTSRLLHHLTSSASSPSAPATRGAFQQLPLKPRGAFQATSTVSDISDNPDRCAEIDGSASARCAIEKARFSGGFSTSSTAESIAASQHTLPKACLRDIANHIFLLSEFLTLFAPGAPGGETLEFGDAVSASRSLVRQCCHFFLAPLMRANIIFPLHGNIFQFGVSTRRDKPLLHLEGVSSRTEETRRC
jgi:hypothetical protein